MSYYPKMFAPLAGLGILSLVLVIGCSSSTSKPLANQVRHEPESIDVSSSNEKRVPSESPFPFLKSHFFCAVAINVDQAYRSPKLKTVEWSSLNQYLKQVLGNDVGQVEKLKRIWVLIDSSATNFSSSTADNSPFIVVFETKEPIGDAFGKSSDGKPATQGTVSNDHDPRLIPVLGSGPSSFATKLGDRAIGVGSEMILMKTLDSSGSSPLSQLIVVQNLDRTVNAWLDFQPLASTLQSVSQMMRTAGSNDNYGQMLSAITDAHFSGDLDDSQFAFGRLNIDDPNVIDTLATLLNDSLMTPTPSASIGMDGLLGTRSAGPQFFESKSPELGMKVVKEIQEKSLSKTSKDAQGISFSISRAEGFEPFLAQVITESQQQIAFARRFNSLQRIAEASKTFFKAKGHVPNDGPLPIGGSHTSEFSWRVAILPELGYQDLYDRFDFEQPWDSETNLKVAQDIPFEFAEGPEGKSSFRLAKGPMRFFGVNNVSPAINQIHDPLNRTALIIELRDELANPWTAPDSELPAEVLETDFGKVNEQGVLFVDADFRVRGIRKSLENISAILTPNGDEKINRQEMILLPVGPEVESPN